MMLLWKKKRKMNIIDTRGFTLVELLVVIAIISVLGAVVAPNAFKVIQRSQTVTDQANLKTLNQVTAFYGHEVRASGDIFEGFDTDQARIEELVNREFLEHEVKPKRKGMFFSWSVEYQRWFYTDENATVFFLFNGEKIFPGDDLTEKGLIGNNWIINSDGTISSQIENNVLLAPMNLSGTEEYQITVNASINGGMGFGILFDSTINNQNRETGFIFQVDDQGKKILIRPRMNNTERVSINLLGGPENYQNHYLWDSLNDSDKNTLITNFNNGDYGRNITPVLAEYSLGQGLTPTQIAALQSENAEIKMEVRNNPNPDYPFSRELVTFINGQELVTFEYTGPNFVPDHTGIRTWTDNNNPGYPGTEPAFSGLAISQ